MFGGLYPEGLPLPLKFEKNKEKPPHNATLQELLKQLGETTQDNDSKKIVKEIVEFYVENKENKPVSYEVTEVIVRLFTKFNSKKVLKKYVQDLVVKKKLIHDIVKNTTQCIQEKIKVEMACDLTKCSEFLYFLSIIQNSPDYDYDLNFGELFPVYISLFNSFSRHASQVEQNLAPVIEELNVVINAVLKQILPVFVKNVSFFQKFKEQYIPSIIMNSYMLLSNETVEFDIRMKVCLIFMYSYNIMEIGKTSIAQLISQTGTPLNLSLNSFEGPKIPKDHLIIVYSAILSVLPEERLVSEKVDGKALLYVLYEGILGTVKSNPGHSSIIVESSRVLAQVAKYMKSIPTDLITPLFLESLFYVSSHMDHFIDTVRNYSKLFFEELVRLAAHHHENDFTDLTELLITKIHDLPDESTMRFLAFENVAKFYGCEFLLGRFELLPLVLLGSVDKLSMNDQVQKTYQVLLEKSFDASTAEARNSWIKTWVLPVLLILKTRRDKEGFCQKVISGAFKLCPSILREIFPSNYVGSVDESKALLNCLRDARKNGFELSDKADNENNTLWRGLIEKQRMDMFLIHQNEEIRVLTLATVTESLKTTEIFLDWEFTFFLSFISYNVTTQTPSVRKQIIAYYKKMLARFDAGLKVIERLIISSTKYLENNPTEREQKKHLLVYQELKKSYRRFISILVRVVIGNLSYDSNFPRRSTSLELLLVIQEILTPDEWKCCWNEDDVKNSHNLIFDTYESNKKMIVKLLKTLPPNYLGFTNVNFTFKYLQRSFNLAMDVKPSKTLSAAYLFEVCSTSPYFYDIVHCECGEETKKLNDPTLDMIVVLTKKFLNQSSEIKLETIGVTKTAVHGLILSIRHLLENRNIEQHNDTYAGVFDHLVSTCFGIAEKIMPVVCNPSPEGYLPDNVEELCDSEESPNAQKVLVYAWRTMKEMTLLLAEIVKQTIKSQEELEMLPEESLKKIGEFFVTVFIQSKHRGVFEQAYVGFSIVCESFWKSNNRQIVRLPANWLTDALNLCTGKTHSDVLCPTRRSAGLPFLILSIITTETNATHFHSTISTLLETVDNNTDCSEETRMHCLNVLRAIYRHSKLGELVASYIARGVILAIEGFKSEAWGIRNSSTLLFAALMTRIFGVQRTSDDEQLCIKNKLTVKVFFMRYQELYKYMLDTLSEECHNKCSLVLQPILMILSRLYPSNFENGDYKVSEYLPHIDVCLGNPSYRVREMAAKASVALIDPEDVIGHFDKCFAKISDPNTISDIECHGTLLQMYHVMKTLNVKNLPLSNYLKLSYHLLGNERRKFSHMTVNLYMELITLFLYASPDFDDLDWLKRILLYLSMQSLDETRPLTSLVNFTATRTILAFYIIVNKLEETDSTYATVIDDIMSTLYGPPSLMKGFFLEFLICLNQTHNNVENAVFSSVMARLGNLSEESDIYFPYSDLEQHPLFATGDLELNSNIVNLVTSFDRSLVENILKHIHPYLKTFMVEDLKNRNYIHDEDRVLLFLLLNYYPCAIKCIRLSKQETLNALVGYCDCDNEELISAAISCISVFLSEVDYSLLRYDKLLEVLSKSASPAAARFRRLTVCDFLCKNTQLYCSAEPVLQGQQLCNVLNIVMVLLEDEDQDVRNAMSNYEDSLRVRVKINNTTHTIPGYKWSVVPEKAKEDLVHLITVLMPQEEAVCMIFSWACRHFPDPSAETQEIFERGDLNIYAENTPLIDICSRVLTKMLWTLPEGVSYESKSIFLEEQTQIVTATLLNSLMKYDSPMMITKSKMSVICGLKLLYKFLEQSEVSGNFATTFRAYLNDTILAHLTQHLEMGDLFSVKKIIRKLYEPVFRQRR